VIVVDGSSTDGTQAILASYGNRVHWLSEPDAGQADALNKGVNLAQGDVIAWINSDDYYPHQQVLPRVLQVFAEADTVDVVYGDGLMVDSRGQAIRLHRGRRLRRVQDMLVRPASFAMQPAVFFRRQLFQAAGGADPHLHWALDYDLWLRMFPAARAVRYVPEVFAHATYHPNSKSISGMLPHIREVWQVKRRHWRKFRLSPGEQALALAGVGSMYAYLVAVRLGLRRAW
jgi:glycosyltransferase involved in cell wall biosynthesis